MKTRITYNKLTKAVDDWNKAHNLKYLDKGFLQVGNDGNVHWLQYLTEQGATKKANVHGTDGTIKSCYQRLYYLTEEDVGLSDFHIFEYIFKKTNFYLQSGQYVV